MGLLYEHRTKEDLIQIILYKDKRYQTLSDRYERLVNSARRPSNDKLLTDRLREQEVEIDTLIKELHRLYEQIAELTNTEPPSFELLYRRFLPE